MPRVRDLTPYSCRMLGQPGTLRSAGMKVEQMLERWPEATRPGLRHLRGVLNKGSEDERWERHGQGGKGNPCTHMRMS